MICVRQEPFLGITFDLMEGEFEKFMSTGLVNYQHYSI